MNRVLDSNLDKVNTSTALSVDSKPPDGIFTLQFTLSYLTLSNFTKHNMHTLASRYCKNLEIILTFSLLKQKLMNLKDYVPRSLDSNVLYKFKCARYNSIYVPETNRHLSTRVCEYLHSQKYKHHSYI